MTRDAAMTCDDFRDLAAAVALDAADAEDAKRVEEHLANCRECSLEFDAIREAAAALALDVPQVDPPPALRWRVLEAAQRERRSPAFGVARFRRRLSPAWLAAAASFLVSIGALAWVAVLHGQVSDLQQSLAVARQREARYERVVQVLRSNSLAIRPLQPASQNLSSSGLVYLDPASGNGMLMCHDLPPIEQGHAYQVWFVRGNEWVSGGMLWPDRSGSGYAVIEVPSDLQSFDSIGITDEPGSGSAWPTTAHVMGTPLKQSSQ